MKYPYVIIYRHDKYFEIDNFFISNNENLNCTIFITNNHNELNKLFNCDYHILITYGDNEGEYIENTNSVIADRMRNRWIHLKEIQSIERFNYMVNYCFVYNCSYDRENIRPVFSIFSSSFNSYEKILRAYNSLKLQTFNDWEWVIIDDSNGDEHFQFLREKFSDDFRIRLYRRGENSGSIGNVKNEAVSLCRGKYLLELDHDDEITPNVLKDATNVFESNSNVGFIYMDFINIYENGDNFNYGDFICKGYGSYYCQKYEGKWRYVYNTPNINNITLSHLVCCPNHPRIWRSELLKKIGNYCELLHICDDYEILLRTAVNTKIVKIPKLGYVQYLNNSNNNFSLIRNTEINRIGPQFIQPIFYKRFNIHEEMKKMDAYEDEMFINVHSKIWTRDENYVHKFSNQIVNVDYDKQYCIIGVDSLIMNYDKIKELYNNPRNDFILIENKCNIHYLWMKLDYYGFDKMKCYTLPDTNNIQLEKYFTLMYKSTENFEIINNNIFKPKFNTNFSERFMIINSLTQKTYTYLEIGVEYGHTYRNVHFENKEGVDPDPKCSDTSIIAKTSDDYFLCQNEKKDAIFIDGLHQSEYLTNDINNSINLLNEGGLIFIDDILPLTHDEQLKIPKKHYYENNILKYGEPWTGDVWKVIYFILENFSENIKFKYYNNANYRGVAVMSIIHYFQIEKESLLIINNYDYYQDYEKYISLLVLESN
jgi:glycosyltransferase involved in cell wall biosynthesis